MNRNAYAMDSIPSRWKQSIRLLVWCAPGFFFPVFASAANPEKGLVVIYLEVPAAIGKDVVLDLEDMVLIGDKDSLTLEAVKTSLSAKEYSGQQILLCEQAIPSGNYAALRLNFKHVVVPSQSNKAAPALPGKGVSTAIELKVVPGAALPIFLYWDPGLDNYDGKIYSPSIQSKPERRSTPAAMAFVSNTGSNYISCIDRFRQRVVDVIGVGQGPMDMVFASMRQDLFVANSGSDNISVIDVRSGRMERNISLRGGDKPGRLALASDQSRLFVLNGGSNSVSVVDLLGYQETHRIHLEAPPAALAMDDQNSVIYVTSRDSDRLFAIDPASFSVTTVLRFDANLEEIAFSRTSRKLFLDRPAQRLVSVFDIAKNTVEINLKLCGPATGFAYQRISSTLFASIPDCNLISILKPNENLDIGAINLPNAPGKISLDPESKYLMVTFPLPGKIGFYNANSWESHGSLDVGKSPFAICFGQ